MKLENKIDDFKSNKQNNNSTSLNQILKDQIVEIEHF